MIIKVNYPIKSIANGEKYFEVEEGSVSKGDIVVVENGEIDVYGVVVKLNVSKKSSQLSSKNVRVANKLDRILFWYDFEQHILKNKVRFGKRALEQYQETRNNKGRTYEELVNKMTRNFMLLHKPYRIGVNRSGSLIFNYGYLQITYYNGTIYYIENGKYLPKGWKKDWHKHWYFTKILNVEFD